MKKSSLAILVMLFSSSSYADISFNGFASIRATAHDSDTGATAFSTLKGNGDISFKDESLFALQAKSDLGNNLSATIQLVAEGINDFDVEARWAYISYTLNDTHTINMGRFANPIFYQSEYEKVGYVHNFSRLPKAVYVGFDFSTIEGVSVDSTYFIDDYTLETKVLYGNWDGSVFLNATGRDEFFALENLFSLRAAFSGEWWKVFAGGFIAEMDGGTIDDFFNVAAAGGVDAAVQNGATTQDVNQLFSAMQWTGKDGVYWYSGFNIDKNNFIVDFEYANYQVEDSSDGVNEVWYAAIGYRMNDFVVTVHTEENKQVIDYDFLNNVNHPILQGTGRAIHNVLAEREFDGSGVTLRYDFHPSAALKVDYFKGTDSQPTVGDYSIWSVGVDLVF